MMMHPVVISEINDKKLAWAPVTHLSNLLKENKEEAKAVDDSMHRVRISVSGA